MSNNVRKNRKKSAYLGLDCETPGYQRRTKQHGDIFVSPPVLQAACSSCEDERKLVLISQQMTVVGIGVFSISCVKGFFVLNATNQQLIHSNVRGVQHAVLASDDSE